MYKLSLCARLKDNHLPVQSAERVVSGGCAKLVGISTDWIMKEGKENSLFLADE